MSKRKPIRNKPNQRNKEQQNRSAKKVNQASKSTSKKTTSSQNTRNITPADHISLVIPCYNEADRLPLLVNGIKKFDRNWGANYQLIIVDDGSQDNTSGLLKGQFDGLSKASDVKIITLEQNQGKGNALKEGVAQATGDFVLTLDADMATSPLELKNWLSRLNSSSFPKDEVLIGSREDKDSKITGRGRRVVGLMFNFVTQMMTSLTARDTQCGFKLYPIAIAREIFGGLKLKGWAHDVELLYKAQLDDVKVTSMPVTWKHVEESKISVWSDGIKMVFATIFNAWRIKFDWFIGQPLKQLGQKATGKEHSVYRLLFAVLTIGLLFLMPMLSADYGVTGDEFTQKTYGDLLDKHFETGGNYVLEGGKHKGENALTMKPNLKYYGGLFDFIATKIYNFTGGDPYATRHWFNAFIGFLLMFFTGLVGKEVSGSWKVGFLALLMIALSPRIFGHSMNNPKDIPFATAYIFTLLHLLRFVKQLPRPGAKTIVYLMIGIGASIGIRIGGLLSVAYLGLFTGIAFLWEPYLRKQLTNIQTLGRIVFYGVLIAFVGFLIGIMNWPYALQDPIAHSLKALEEMSNFDTGIQMLYAGKHYWSDQLPWYYIPKWMLMAAPIAILLGAALFTPVALFNKNRKTLLVGLLLFAGIFPVAYAIYQGSALYDGMRHFLFVYPILAILGAYGWGHLTSLSNNKAVSMASIALPVLLLALPATWMIKNHPYQYTYINELYGGTASLEGNYETDYWMTSVKQLCEWFAENVPEAKSEEGVTVLMSTHNEAAKHYFKELAPNVRVTWKRYPERDRVDTWDYAILFSRFMNEGHLKSGAWPPYEVLHEEKVDGVTIGVVTKKGDSQAGAARTLLQQGRIDTAIQMLNTELTRYPKNEVAWLALADAYRMKRDFVNMDKAVNGALRLSNSYVNGLAMKGFRFYNEFEVTRQSSPNMALVDSALLYYDKAIALNYKFSTGYLYRAFCNYSKQNVQAAIADIELFAENNGTTPQAYDLGINLTKNDPIRQKYFQARKLMTQKPPNFQQAFQLSSEVFRLNPNYEPGKKLKEYFDEQIAAQKEQQQQKRLTQPQAPTPNTLKK